MVVATKVASWPKGKVSERLGFSESADVMVLACEFTMRFRYSVATSRLFIRTRKAIILSSGGRAPWIAALG